MSTIDASSFDAVQPPWPVRRFTVEEYRQLGACGVLTADDRVELLDGWIVPKMNQRPAHGYVVGLLNAWFQQRIPAGLIVRCQLPITTDASEPEPDLAIVRGDHTDYRERHPSGTECRLIVEVADTSVERDRLKAGIYASAGVEEYWIVNLAESQLERFTCPEANSFQASSVQSAADCVDVHLGDSAWQLELTELLA